MIIETWTRHQKSKCYVKGQHGSFMKMSITMHSRMRNSHRSSSEAQHFSQIKQQPIKIWQTFYTFWWNMPCERRNFVIHTVENIQVKLRVDSASKILDKPRKTRYKICLQNQTNFSKFILSWHKFIITWKSSISHKIIR